LPNITKIEIDSRGERLVFDLEPIFAALEEIRSLAQSDLIVANEASPHSPAIATGYGTISIGDSSHVEGGSSAGLGVHVRTIGNYNFAVGYYSTAQGNNNIVVGSVGENSTGAYGNHNTVFGAGARAGSSGSHANYCFVAVQGAKATGGNGTAIGRSSTAAENAIAIGELAQAILHGGIAVGSEAEALGINGVAIGDLARAEKLNGAAIGENSKALDIASSAFGASSTAIGDGATAIGNGAHAEGAEHDVEWTGATALGNKASAIGQESIAAGARATAKQKCSAYGYGANAGFLPSRSYNTEYDSAFGGNSGAHGGYATAVGHAAKAYMGYATAVGNGATADSGYATAIGTNSGAHSGRSLAVGYNANVGNGAQCATAIGNAAGAHREGCTAIGDGATIPSSWSGERHMVLGHNLSSLQSNVYLTLLSDERDKTDIAPIAGALEFIKAVNPVQFVFNSRDDYAIPKDELTEEQRELKHQYGITTASYDREAHQEGTLKGDRKRAGVIAQQVQEVMLRLFGSDNYADIVNDNLYGQDLPDGVENRLSVNMSGFVPFLISAVQELSAQNEQLSAKYDELLGRIEALENTRS